MVLCRLLYDKNVIYFYDSEYYYHQSINQEALILLSGYVISFLVFWYFGDPWSDVIEINPFFRGKSRISIPQEWDEWSYLLFWVEDYGPLILGLTFRAWFQALRLSISSTPLPSHPHCTPSTTCQHHLKSWAYTWTTLALEIQPINDRCTGPTRRKLRRHSPYAARYKFWLKTCGNPSTEEWRFLKKLKIDLAYDPGIPLQAYTLRKP